jgi:hypothetical protein
MDSSEIGKCILESNVTSITDLGFWVLAGDNEYFVPFKEYPGFIDASVKQILNISFMPTGQLHWEDLDIDIELLALTHPEAFPLVFR